VYLGLDVRRKKREFVANPAPFGRKLSSGECGLALGVPPLVVVLAAEPGVQPWSLRIIPGRKDAEFSTDSTGGFPQFPPLEVLGDISACSPDRPLFVGETPPSLALSEGRAMAGTATAHGRGRTGLAVAAARAAPALATFPAAGPKQGERPGWREVVELVDRLEFTHGSAFGGGFHGPPFYG